MVLATQVWSQISLPSSQPGIVQTQAGAEFLQQVPFATGVQAEALVVEIEVIPLMHALCQSMFGVDTSKKGYPRM